MDAGGDGVFDVCDGWKEARRQGGREERRRKGKHQHSMQARDRQPEATTMQQRRTRLKHKTLSLPSSFINGSLLPSPPTLRFALPFTFPFILLLLSPGAGERLELGDLPAQKVVGSLDLGSAFVFGGDVVELLLFFGEGAAGCGRWRGRCRGRKRLRWFRFGVGRGRRSWFVCRGRFRSTFGIERRGR
jgi:hypothetical protein